MFGKNYLAGQDKGDGGHLWVHEVFSTIQGEGPEAGRAAIFIRLSGCNLRCFFCDTDFESIKWQPSVEEIIKRVEDLCLRTAASLVVITGGEPLRQQIGPLVRRLRGMSFDVQIETAGTLWPEGFEELFEDQEEPVLGRLSIVCSPKTPKVHPMIERHASAFKYIVRARDPRDPSDGLPLASTQVPGGKARIHRGNAARVWVQPCEEYFAKGQSDHAETERNVQLAAQITMEHGYRLSLQIHKMIGLP